MYLTSRGTMSRRLVSFAWFVIALATACTANAQVIWQGGTSVRMGGQTTGSQLPGFGQLSEPGTAKEIELTDDQRKELQALSEELQEQHRDLFKPLHDKSLSPEQRREMSLELQKKSTEIHMATNAKVKQVLLPHQLQWLEEIAQRRRILTLVQHDYYLQGLELTEKQREELNKSRERLGEKIAKAQREMYAEVLKLLTPEQLKKLNQPYGQAKSADAM